MSQNAPDVEELFGNAENDGVLGADSIQVLTVPDMGAKIQAGLGIAVDDVPASDVTLVTMMPDDSGSIRFVQGNTEAVREGHNLVLDALGASKQTEGILAHCRYLNGKILYPYVPLIQAVRMDQSNFNPNLGTPLYDQTVVVLGTVLVKVQDFADSGVPARSVTLLITDGNDEHSTTTAAQVCPIVTDMLGQEDHIIAAMGINDGTTNFRAIFGEMGILDEWILTPGNSPQEIRAAFLLFSQSAVRASQGTQSFSRIAGGGFAEE